MSSNGILVIVLGGSFLAVGVHLFLWSRRTRTRFRRFARERRLLYIPTDREGLEERLQQTFGLNREDAGRRGFSQVSDLIPFEGGVLFRMVQILDMTRFTTAANAHAAHAAIMVDVPQATNLRGIFQKVPGDGLRQRFPLEGTDQSTAVSALLQSLDAPTPAQTLTISFAKGRALAYLEPSLVGSVTLEHLDFLLRLGQALSKQTAASN